MSPSNLSPRALDWLRSIDFRRRRAPLDPAALRRQLEAAGAAWAPLLALEERFGGHGGDDFYLGVDGTPDGADGAVLADAVLGRPHVWIGGTEWILWYMDGQGRVAEVDDQRRTFYVADSVEHRIEQVALTNLPVGAHVERLDGARGAWLAARLALVALPEPSDSRQRYWATPGFTRAARDAVLVRESLEPVDYGAEELGTFTWVECGTEGRLAEVRRALG